MKDFFSKEFKDLLTGRASLITIQQGDRLTIPQIKEHPFFKKVDWNKVLKKNNGKTPIKPFKSNDTKINIKDRNLLAFE